MGISKEDLGSILEFAGIGLGTVGNVFAPGIAAAAGAAVGQAGTKLKGEQGAEARAAKAKREENERLWKRWYDFAKKIEKKKKPAYESAEKARLLDEIIAGDLAMRDGRLPDAQFREQHRMYVETLRQMVAAMATIEESD